MGTAGTTEWALADVFGIVSDSAPDRDAIVWRDSRQTFSETRARTDAHAAFLVEGAKAAARRGGYPLPAWAE